MSLLFLNIFQEAITQRYDKTDASIEIAIMLILSALFGYLLNYFVGHMSKKEIIIDNNNNKFQEIEKLYTKKSSDFDILNKDNLSLKSEIEQLKLKLNAVNTTIPNVSPTIVTPEVETKIETPVVNTPVVETKIETPEVNIPIVETKIETPEVNIPIVETKIETPEVNIPVVETKIETPKVNIPVVETKIETPEVEIAPVMEKKEDATIVDASSENILKVEKVDLEAQKAKNFYINEKKEKISESNIIDSNKSNDTEYNVEDLKIIEGIGPAIEKLLNEKGIFTFDDLANKTVMQLEKILDEAGPRFRVHVPETWPFQATLLKDKRYAEFKVLTTELKGGRRF